MAQRRTTGPAPGVQLACLSGLQLCVLLAGSGCAAGAVARRMLPCLAQRQQGAGGPRRWLGADTGCTGARCAQTVQRGSDHVFVQEAA